MTQYRDTQKSGSRSTLAMTLCAGVVVLAGCATEQRTLAFTEPASTGTATQEIAPPPTLTADERIIWGTLTDDAKQQALQFIANGGTLTQFVQA